jgi:SMODS and SLOG-associating 2TM effector domain family 4
MFRISVVDHIRLNFDRTSQNYTLHAKAAERLAVVTARIRIGVLILLAIAAVTAATSLMEPGRYVQIAAASAAGLAFAAHAAYLAIGVEGRVHAHRSCAQRLWLVCDRYQALLSEIEDGLLDRASILQRRDELSAQVNAAYDQAFSLDQKAYESARHASDTRQVDLIGESQEPALPAPLQQGSDEAMPNPPVPH